MLENPQNNFQLTIEDFNPILLQFLCTDSAGAQDLQHCHEEGPFHSECLRLEDSFLQKILTLFVFRTFHCTPRFSWLLMASRS